jgi:hypothetical protein
MTVGKNETSRVSLDQWGFHFLDRLNPRAVVQLASLAKRGGDVSKFGANGRGW